VHKTGIVKALTVIAVFVVLAASCVQRTSREDSAAQRIADREAIEDALNRANLGFELGDADLLAGAFAEDAVFKLDEKGPVRIGRTSCVMFCESSRAGASTTSE
jgi:hypothetical protein